MRPLLVICFRVESIINASIIYILETGASCRWVWKFYIAFIIFNVGFDIKGQY